MRCTLRSSRDGELSEVAFGIVCRAVVMPQTHGNGNGTALAIALVNVLNEEVLLNLTVTAAPWAAPSATEARDLKLHEAVDLGALPMRSQEVRILRVQAAAL